MKNMTEGNRFKYSKSEDIKLEKTSGSLSLTFSRATQNYEYEQMGQNGNYKIIHLTLQNSLNMITITF